MTDEPRTAPPEHDPLTWEGQNARRAGLFAVAAGLLGLVGVIVTGLSNAGSPSAEDKILTLTDTLGRAAAGQPIPAGQSAIVLEFRGHHAAGFIAGAILTGLALLATFPALAYLYRAARARGPVPRFALLSAAVGTAAAGIGQIASQSALYLDAASFANGTDHSNSAAFDAQNGSVYLAGGLIGGLGGLFLAVAFVLICLHAMRAGLLTRLMGVLGMFGGATLVVRFLDPPGVIRWFWLIALGVLFLGRMPRGRPPAWAVAEAVPWPSQQQIREQRDKARREAAGEREPPAPARRRRGPAEGDGSPPAESATKRVPAPRAPQPRRDDAVPGRPHPASKKRKRKRRS